MKVAKLTLANNIWPLSALVLIIFLLSLQQLIQCQVTDGDEQFQAYHQDIGRISASPSTSPVAPQTIVRQLSPVTPAPAAIIAAPLPPQVFAERAPASISGGSSSSSSSFNGRNRANHHNSGPQRNRITLAIRTSAPALPEQLVQPSSASSLANIQPSHQQNRQHHRQLPNNQQQQQSPPQLANNAASVAHHQALAQIEPNFSSNSGQQSAASSISSSSSQLIQANAPQQQQSTLNSFLLNQQVFHQPAAVLQHQQQQSALDHSSGSAAAGPALSSFRSAANSVSARHSALMAQVAAERLAAASAANFNNNNNNNNNEQPSLGSPLEALSSPAISLVQPPPTLQASAASLTNSQLTATATTSSSSSSNFVNQPEEPLVAPTFEHIQREGCPLKGVFSYENRDYCDRYYMCTNGTFTEEACPNGLAYSQMGAVYQHCAYNWNVDCGLKKTSEPLSSPGCPWQFGIFPATTVGRCSIDYFVCEWGVPETKRCSPEGLFYDDRIKGCQWADQLGCKSENLLNFKCPPEDEDNPYWPYPRYYHTKQDVIVCVNEQPRLVHCNEEQIVDPSSLACLDLKKKKKKF